MYAKISGVCMILAGLSILGFGLTPLLSPTPIRGLLCVSFIVASIFAFKGKQVVVFIFTGIILLGTIVYTYNFLLIMATHVEDLTYRLTDKLTLFIRLSFWHSGLATIFAFVASLSVIKSRIHTYDTGELTPLIAESNGTVSDYATIKSRIFAGIIDFFVLILIDVILLGIFALMEKPLLILSIYSIPAVWLLYYIYLESNFGQTCGKKVMEIKVIRVYGGKPTYDQSIMRTIIRVIDMLPLFYILGLVTTKITNRKQRIGDILARTIVVKE